MILGIDIGTSVTKAALVDVRGRSRHHASRPSRLAQLGNGRVEQDLDDVVHSVAAVVQEVIAGYDGTIEAVALTGQGDGLWLRDENGTAVRPPISWMDARASEIVREWSEGGEESVADRVYRLTGSGLFPGSHAGLLAYLDRHEPQSLERAAVAGYCVDAVVQRLTGAITVDASDASLPFLDVTRRDYVDAALELCGISRWRHLLGTPAAPHTVFALNHVGATLLGLPEGTPVTAGPYDLQACGFGSGTTRNGEGTLVVGTTLSCQALTTDTSIPPASEPAGMWLATPDPASYLRVMPSMVGTASIDWLMNLFGLSATDLSGMLAATAPGASDVRALSFFSPSGERAPFVDPAARGQFLGLQLGTSRADIVRALSESLAYAARHCFEYMGLDGELAACGGGLRSDAWAQLFSDVMGVPIHIPTEDQVGIRGAARVAWESLGTPVDDELWRSQRRTLRPDLAAAELYDRGYQRYLGDLSDARTAWRQG